MDEMLGKLRETRALLLIEKERDIITREQSIALTHIDTAILWIQEDMRLKKPPINKYQKL